MVLIVNITGVGNVKHVIASKIIDKRGWNDAAYLQVSEEFQTHYGVVPCNKFSVMCIEKNSGDPIGIPPDVEMAIILTDTPMIQIPDICIATTKSAAIRCLSMHDLLNHEYTKFLDDIFKKPNQAAMFSIPVESISPFCYTLPEVSDNSDKFPPEFFGCEPIYTYGSTNIEKTLDELAPIPFIPIDTFEHPEFTSTFVKPTNREKIKATLYLKHDDQKKLELASYVLTNMIYTILDINIVTLSSEEDIIKDHTLTIGTEVVVGPENIKKVMKTHIVSI